MGKELTDQQQRYILDVWRQSEKNTRIQAEVDLAKDIKTTIQRFCGHMDKRKKKEEMGYEIERTGCAKRKKKTKKDIFGDKIAI